MKIEMLENGIDSLKRGFQAYLQYKEEIKGTTPTTENYLLLKQAILNTHHGVEILLKYIVQNKSEFLIINDIDKNYKQAYDEKRRKGLTSVFNSSKASKIRTITYEEAIERARDLCEVQFGQDVEKKLNDLNEYRNALTHAEIDVDDKAIEDLFDGLLLDLDVLFRKSIGDEYQTFYGFSEVKANYDHYMKFYDDEKLLLKKAAIEAFKKAIEKTGMYEVGVGSIAYTEDIGKTKVFLKEMQQNMDFGMDLFNGYCSGRAKIKIKDNEHLSIWADDNKNEYIIKFKSLMLFVPEYKSNMSPILILESADDMIEGENAKYVYEDVLEGRFIEDYIEYDQYKLQEFYNRCDYDETFREPKNYGVIHFLKGRIFGCFNIQGLRYWNFHALLKAAEGKTGVEFKNILEQLIKKEQDKER